MKYNKRISAWIILLWMVVVGCSHSTSTNSLKDDLKEDTLEVKRIKINCEDKRSLFFWLSEIDSVDQNVLTLADVVWKYSGDSVVQANIDSMLTRQMTVERELLNAYNSTIKVTAGVNKDPIDVIIDSIKVLVDKYVDDGINSSVMSNAIQWKLKYFLTAKCYNEILQYDPTFRDEILQWKALNDLLIKYGCGVISLRNRGETTTLMLHEMLISGICDARLDDALSILRMYQGEHQTKYDNDTKELKLVDVINYPFVELEGTTDGENVEKYKRLYKKTRIVKDKIPEALNSWYKTRKMMANSRLLIDRHQDKTFNSLTTRLESLLVSVFCNDLLFGF